MTKDEIVGISSVPSATSRGDHDGDDDNDPSSSDPNNINMPGLDVGGSSSHHKYGKTELLGSNGGGAGGGGGGMGAVISSPLGGTEGGAGGGGGGYGAKVGGAAEGILGRMYSSCEGNPLGAVHRAWGVSLIFIVIFFVVAIAEGELYSVVPRFEDFYIIHLIPLSVN